MLRGSLLAALVVVASVGVVPAGGTSTARADERPGIAAGEPWPGGLRAGQSVERDGVRVSKALGGVMGSASSGASSPSAVELRTVTVTNGRQRAATRTRPIVLRNLRAPDEDLTRAAVLAVSSGATACDGDALVWTVTDLPVGASATMTYRVGREVLADSTPQVGDGDGAQGGALPPG